MSEILLGRPSTAYPIAIKFLKDVPMTLQPLKKGVPITMLIIYIVETIWGRDYTATEEFWRLISLLTIAGLFAALEPADQLFNVVKYFSNPKIISPGKLYDILYYLTMGLVLYTSVASFAGYGVNQILYWVVGDNSSGYFLERAILANLILIAMQGVTSGFWMVFVASVI